MLIGFAGAQGQYGLSQFQSTAEYPVNASGFSCATNSSYVYCVGGYYSNGGTINFPNSYYSTLSANGISGWKTTASYPGNFLGNTCVSNEGYIYCIGDLSNAQDTYFANLTANGIEDWRSTSNYPLANTTGISCVAQSGYIFCMGGQSASPNTNAPSNLTYYANLTKDGIGAWQQTATYPINVSGQLSCFGEFGFIYCLGGFVNSSYYSFVGPNGIVGWQTSANYSYLITGTSCLENNSDAYCVGGLGVNTTSGNSVFGITNSVYFGYSYSDGVLGWYKSNESYPVPIYSPQCFNYTNTLYCVGGDTLSGSSTGSASRSAYYAEMLHLSSLPSSLTVSSTTTTTIPTTVGTAFPGSTIPNNNFTVKSTQSTTIPQKAINASKNKSGNTTAMNRTNFTNVTPPYNGSINISVSNTTNSSVPAKHNLEGPIAILVALIAIIIAAVVVWFFAKKRNG